MIELPQGRPSAWFGHGGRWGFILGIPDYNQPPVCPVGGGSGPVAQLLGMVTGVLVLVVEHHVALVQTQFVVCQPGQANSGASAGCHSVTRLQCSQLVFWKVNCDVLIILQSNIVIR